MVTEFLTTTLLGGIIYDLMKIGVSNSYELAKRSLKDFTTSEDEIRYLKLILEKDILTKSALSKEKIIDILDNNEKISFLIKKVKRMNVNYAETININTINKISELPHVDEKFLIYNNRGVSFFLIGIVLISIFLPILKTPYVIVIIGILMIIFYHYIDKKLSKFVTIYNNKLVNNGDEIKYKDISSHSMYSANIITLKLYNTGKQIDYKVKLQYPSDIEFLIHCIEQFRDYNRNMPI
ncbi:hypothetical protein [Arcobacter sp.]|uniref:hypothetical protein n=1 Tax=unclassified Arcobacter TaxID=2593671 RepID=UPI003B007158